MVASDGSTEKFDNFFFFIFMQFSGKFGRVIGCRPSPLGLVSSLGNPGFDTGSVIILNTISKRQDGSDLFRILHTKSFSKFTEASVYYVIAAC